MKAIKCSEMLTKRIPKNPKYDHVQPVVNTGSSLSSYMNRMEEIREDFKFRNDEIFKRMKISTFVQLVLQVENINISQELQDFVDKSAESVESVPLRTDSNDDVDCSSNLAKVVNEGDVTDRSTLQSVISGCGEYDCRQKKEAVDDEIMEDPYLLLDVRDSELFQQCHIIKAKNYPMAMLSRSINFETQHMLDYRNKAGKIIVIYDEDEKLASRAATTLFQRGYDNLFLLSGGLKVAAKRFPNGLITGDLPQTVKAAVNIHIRKKTGCKQLGRSSLTGSASVASSNTPTLPGYDGMTSNDKTIRDYFTRDDLVVLENHLQNVLTSKSTTATSRVSGLTEQASIARSNLEARLGRPAFK